MANLRDIRKRISSVQSTEQITRTMEMVSTAKIRRALDRAMQAEPYKAVCGGRARSRGARVPPCAQSR